MLRLEDVLIDNIYGKLYRRRNKQHYSQNDNEYIKKIYDKYNLYIDLLEQNGIFNYADLKAFLENPENLGKAFAKELKKELLSVEEKITMVNMLNVEPNIHIVDSYSQAKDEDRELLDVIDENTYGCKLLLNRPVKARSTYSSKLSRSSIAILKYRLEHIDSNLRNTFQLDYCLSREEAEKTVKLIKFYEEQVLRQLASIRKDHPTSYQYFVPKEVFDYEYDEKCDIVESQLDEIAEYLVESGNSFVWGSLNDEEKLRIMKCIKTPNHFIKKNLVDAISNYTTLDELEQGVVKKRTLDRFIIK